MNITELEKREGLIQLQKIKNLLVNKERKDPKFIWDPIIIEDNYSSNVIYFKVNHFCIILEVIFIDKDNDVTYGNGKFCGIRLIMPRIQDLFNYDKLKYSELYNTILRTNHGKFKSSIVLNLTDINIIYDIDKMLLTNESNICQLLETSVEKMVSHQILFGYLTKNLLDPLYLQKKYQ